MNRDFKGVWIPREIWLSKDLSLQEKVFLVEISSLNNEKGCFAKNTYFAEFFNLSKTRVSLVIKSLIDKGYIRSEIVYKSGTKQIEKRVLRVIDPYLRNSKYPYLRNSKYPIYEKVKDNNIINNTNINIKGEPEDFSPNQLKTTIRDRQLVFQKELANYTDKYDKELLRKFYDYWTEPNRSGTKMRFEMEKTWDTKRRLVRWKSSDFNKEPKKRIGNYL